MKKVSILFIVLSSFCTFSQSLGENKLEKRLNELEAQVLTTNHSLETYRKIESRYLQVIDSLVKHNYENGKITQEEYRLKLENRLSISRKQIEVIKDEMREMLQEIDALFSEK